MNVVIDGVLLVLLALVLVPVTVLLVEVLSALVPRRPVPLLDVIRPCLAVLVPAHNESVGILGTLNSVLPQLSEGDRMIVVADNCSDDTAQIAAAAGAEVVERWDPSRRGKGYALDAGVGFLEQDETGNAPAIVIIIDADCQVSPSCLDRLACVSAAAGSAVQAKYLMKAPQSAGVMGQIAEFAWTVKNNVRPLGLSNLGLACNLMGSGMALPWPAVRSLRLAGGDIVEDLSMSVEIARGGMAALYCPEAVVRSTFPSNRTGTLVQRTRWVHGHLGMIFGPAGSLFLSGLKNRDPRLLILALDISVPPLALLGLVLGSLAVLCLLNTIVTASLLPLFFAGVLNSMFITAVLFAWWRFGRDVVSFTGLLKVFAYVLHNIPLYVTFVTRRQRDWLRSKRDAE